MEPTGWAGAARGWEPGWDGCKRMLGLVAMLGFWPNLCCSWINLSLTLSITQGLCF